MFLTFAHTQGFSLLRYLGMDLHWRQITRVILGNTQSREWEIF